MIFALSNHFWRDNCWYLSLETDNSFRCDGACTINTCLKAFVLIVVSQDMIHSLELQSRKSLIEEMWLHLRWYYNYLRGNVNNVVYRIIFIQHEVDHFTFICNHKNLVDVKIIDVYFYIILAIFFEFNNLKFSSSLIVRFCSKNSRVFWTTKFRQPIASVKWGELSLTWMIKWLNIAYCWTNIPESICPSQRMWMKKWNTDIISLLKGYFHLSFLTLHSLETFRSFRIVFRKSRKTCTFFSFRMPARESRFRSSDDKLRSSSMGVTVSFFFAQFVLMALCCID